MVIYYNNSRTTTINCYCAMIDSYPSHDQRSEVFEARGLPTKYVMYGQLLAPNTAKTLSTQSQ